MSDLTKTRTPPLEQEKVFEINETCIKETELKSSGIQNLTNNCNEDDKDVIVVKTMEVCDRNGLTSINIESTFILDNQMKKLHIDGKNSRHPEICISTGTCSKIHDQRNQTIKNKRADQSDDTHAIQSPCDSYINESGVISFTMANSVSEKKRIASCINTDIDIQSNEIKHFPTLLKSQSLDLYNDDITFLNMEQKLHNRILPKLNEYRSSEIQIPQANRNDGLNAEEIQQCSSGTEECTSQVSIQRANILTSVFTCTESRPIYPNVPYSPYGSPRSVRRRPPLRESRRISIEKSGSFFQLNQYKLMDQIGQVVNKFLLSLSIINLFEHSFDSQQGSYGLVKLAYSEEDSTHYAMKILSKKRLLRQAALMRRSPKQSTSPLDRVYREIAVLKKLDHPNIVKLVEVLDDPLEDSLYMVFELVKKGEVLCIPTDKPLSEERAWNVIRDTLLGLEYLHYQKIIHADLKPGNLLLTECGHVKIADLGVCNEFLGEDATMSNGSTAGTPAFRAPETLVLGMNVYCGRAADIWALGATLYSLIYGNVPFIANSIPLLYEKIKNDDVIFPDFPIISDVTRHCIIRMLEKDASRRITLPQLKIDPWVTNNGIYPLPTEDENCCLVQVDDEDINSVVRSIPKLDTLILIKTMLKNHSFGNPFFKGISGKAPQKGGSRLQKFVQAGRSNSAPGSYHMALDR
ncbi:hypothetical protein KR044_003173, partial [Drosophila immigrans]